MKTEHIEFYSGPDKVRAIWRTPETEGPFRAIVQGPGWLGLKDAKDYLRYHEGFTNVGFGVLSIDYRGFGDSEGERGIVNPTHQLEDLINAVTYLTTRDDVIPTAIGAFATGGTGGGNVVMLAGYDERVRAVVSQFPVADGELWLHQMRNEWDWVEYKKMLEEDRKQRVLTGESRMIHPRNEIMVQTPERLGSDFKKDVDKKIQMSVPAAMVDPLLRYRPIDAARGLTAPLMVVTVEDDATTPTDHAEAIYQAAAGPKRLLIQRDTGHYTAYTKYAEVVIPKIVGWLDTYVQPLGGVIIKDDDAASSPFTNLGE